MSNIKELLMIPTRINLFWDE